MRDTNEAHDDENLAPLVVSDLHDYGTTHDYATREVLGSKLDSSMVLVGESGGLSAIYEVGASSAMPGLVRVETEHGPLYLDPDETYPVLDK
jgi:hypothetical protein